MVGGQIQMLILVQIFKISYCRSLYSLIISQFEIQRRTNSSQMQCDRHAVLWWLDNNWPELKESMPVYFYKDITSCVLMRNQTINRLAISTVTGATLVSAQVTGKRIQIAQLAFSYSRNHPVETSDLYVSLRCWSYLQLGSRASIVWIFLSNFTMFAQKQWADRFYKRCRFKIVLAAQVGQAGAASGERIPGIFALSAFSNKQLVGCFQESETLSSSFKNSGRERSNQSRSSRKRWKRRKRPNRWKCLKRLKRWTVQKGLKRQLSCSFNDS